MAAAAQRICFWRPAEFVPEGSCQRITGWQDRHFPHCLWNSPLVSLSFVAFGHMKILLLGRTVSFDRGQLMAPSPFWSHQWLPFPALAAQWSPWSPGSGTGAHAQHQAVRWSTILSLLGRTAQQTGGEVCACSSPVLAWTAERLFVPCSGDTGPECSDSSTGRQEPSSAHPCPVLSNAGHWIFLESSRFRCILTQLQH